MLKYYLHIIVCCFLLLFNISYCQTLNIDSVKKRIENAKDNSLYAKGIQHKIDNEHKNAISAFTKSLEYAKINKDKILVILCEKEIAEILCEIGNYSLSMEYGYNALKEAELAKNDYLAMIINNIIGRIIRLESKKTKKPIFHFNKSLKLANKLSDKDALILALKGIGNTYAEIYQFDSALFYQRKVMDISNENIESCEKLPFGQFNIGGIYYNLNKFDSALFYYNKVNQILNNCNKKDIRLYSNVKKGIGRIYYELGDYKKAVNSLEEAHLIANKVNSKLLIYKAVFDLYKVYKRLNQFERSLHYLELAQTYRDSLFSKENTAKFATLEANYRYEKEKQQLLFNQEKETLKLEEEKRRLNAQQKAAIVGLAIMVIMSAIISRAYRSKNKAYKKLNLLNNKLHQLDQFRVRLFANINHDFRTPLTLINGYVSRINKNKDNYLTSETEYDLQNLKNNTSVLIEMTEEIQNLLLLEESKLKLKFSKISINDYLKTLIQMFSSAAEQNQIKINFLSEIKNHTVVHLDKYHFEKIIFNLLSNSIRYTRSGGHIDIRLLKLQESIKIEIEDNGQGIEEKELPFIFDRFYQSSKNDYCTKEGFGIGLAVVKELVSLHQGEILVSSKINQGTKITIILPFNLEMPLTKEKSLSDKNGKRSILIEKKEAKNKILDFQNGIKNSLQEKSHTVLVVDDHEEIRKYICDIIKNNYKIIEASNGKQALSLLEKEKVDLILTDMMMPQMDGLTFIESLSEIEKYSQIPLMVISARTGEIDKLNVLNKGINEFLSKPFNPDELEKRIFNILNAKQQVDSPWKNIAKSKNIQTSIDKSTFEKLNQIILSKIDDPNLTIEVLATELCASRSKTIRMVKKLTDKTPLAYIKCIRMDYVAHLIKENKVKNNTEAAKSIGLKNATDFAKQYQKHFGEMPF